MINQFNENLGLIILPTESCNLRCAYCYEDFACGKMSQETVGRLKKFLSLRARTTKSLSLSWFGGEPLLALDVVQDVSAHAANLFGAKLHGSMTTNGTLLDETACKTIVSCQVKHIQISLDGVGREHDLTRISPSQKHGFDKIVENLRNLHRSTYDISVTLRLHMHKNRTSAIRQLVDFVTDEFSSDPRFSAFIKEIFGPVARTEGKNTASENTTATTFHEETTKLNTAFVSKPPMPVKEVCYAAMPNSFVIRSDGSISKCTVALKDKKNCIGYLKDNGTLDIDQSKFQFWIRGFASENKDALRCPNARRHSAAVS